MAWSATVAARVLSVCARRRNATAWIMVLALAGNLREIVAESRISASFGAKLSSLLSTQPLLSSQDQVSFAEETELGTAEICASRSGQCEKPRTFCGDLVFWLLLTLHESTQVPDFCLEVSPIPWWLDRVGAGWGRAAEGATVDMGEELDKESKQIRGEIH